MAIKDDNGISPPDNGTKVRVVEFSPLDAATEAKMQPNFRGLPVKHPLMHRTRSLDYAVVLSDGIDMMLESKSEQMFSALPAIAIIGQTSRL